MTPAELRKMQKRAKKDQKGKQPVAAASSSEAGDIKVKRCPLNRSASLMLAGAY